MQRRKDGEACPVPQAPAAWGIPSNANTVGTTDHKVGGGIWGHKAPL